MKCAKSKGFTLVEVIMVIALIGVISAIAVPTYHKLRPVLELKATARDLLGSMQGAKMNAVKRTANVIIELDDVAGKYTVFVDDGGTTGTADDETRNGDEAILVSNSMENGITMSSSFSLGSKKPGYTPMALPYKSRIGNIVFQNGNNKQYRVVLSAAGAARIEMSTDGSTWN